jgi:hypothetical protein
MQHPSSLYFGNQGKENHYNCVILHLWALGTRERGNHDKCVILLLSNLGTRERGIITSVSSSFFLIWEPWEVKSLSVRHPSLLGFENQRKENHCKCVIFLFPTLETRKMRIMINAASFIFVLWEPGKRESL